MSYQPYQPYQQYQPNNNYNQIHYQNDYQHEPYPKADDELYDQGRARFIQKVYLLLAGSLLFTTVICVWAMNSQSFKTMFVNVPAMVILSLLLMVISFTIGCCYERVRQYALPIFIVFVIVESIFVGIICSQTTPSIVLTATAITTVIVLALTAYACYTKSDLTGWGPYLAVLCIVLLVMGIIMIFWRNPIAYLIYSGLTALLFSIYLIFDTQMVLGRFQNSYSLDDAYMATLQLYTDIIQIFIQLIRILGLLQNN